MTTGHEQNPPAPFSSDRPESGGFAAAKINPTGGLELEWHRHLRLSVRLKSPPSNASGEFFASPIAAQAPGAHRCRAVLYRPEVLYYEMAPGSGTPLPADGRTGAWLPSARRIMTNTGDQPAGKRAAPAIVAD
jgi:hypothetical protein